MGHGDKAMNPTTKWADHGARWLAHDLGRWLAPDPPLDYPEAKKVMAAPWNFTNPYTALGNNPVLYEDDNGRVLHFGDDVSPEFRAKFAQVIRMANKLALAGPFAKLHASDKLYRISGLDQAPQVRACSHACYDPDTRTIYWNPKTVLEFIDGSQKSPAEIVRHETIHAVHHDRDPVGFSTRNSTAAGKAAEEGQTIDENNDWARSQGRHQRGTDAYKIDLVGEVEDPTSVEPDDWAMAP